MKLQKVFAYKYGDKSHYKYLVTIPEEIVEELGWKPGGEVDLFVEEYEKLHPDEYKKLKQGLSTPVENRGILHIVYLSDPVEKPKTNPEPKMTYEEFKSKIEKELKENPNGLTWTELKERLKLPQTVPNNKWVRQMEKDMGLLRIKEAKGLVWRLRV